MMGTRGRYTGDECDAFSRYSRSIITWRRREPRAIKARWWRRSRAKEKVVARQDGRQAPSGERKIPSF